MNTLCQLVQLLSAGCVGIFAGAMLTEGFVLVPYWQSLSPSEFFAWYAANDRRLLNYFSPVTTLTAVVTVLSAILSVWTAHPARWAVVGSCVAILIAVATFFLYFEAANASFSAATVAPEALGAELSRWALWHHSRTLLSLIALVGVLFSLHRGA